MPYIIRRLDLTALPSCSPDDSLPDYPVIYIVFDKQQVYYVGATRSLLNRWPGHRNNYPLRKIVKRSTVKVAWAAVRVEQFADLEPALIQFLSPKLNRCRKGKTYHHQSNGNGK